MCIRDSDYGDRVADRTRSRRHRAQPEYQRDADFPRIRGYQLREDVPVSYTHLDVYKRQFLSLA